jgi:bifunctional UDP-N-acetylglucosamine pyrophosphorylase/glucosamine-1-phosphate N-acetyltransferase
MADSSLAIVILAAGEGKRMRSSRPKVLHLLAHQPLLAHVLQAAQALQPHSIHVVYGKGGDQVQATINLPGLHWVEQARRLGTGHAVAQAMPAIADHARVLVLYGDVPLIQPATLQALLDTPADSVALLVAKLDDPSGYGRILRDAQGGVLRIVEEKDADAATRQIREINTGILAAPAALLRRWLAELRSDNAQGEYYLTDIIGMAVRDQCPAQAFQVADPNDPLGVNDRLQLATLERLYQRRQAENLMRSGVTLRDPARLDIRGEVTAGEDVLIDINAVLQGRVSLGNRVQIGANCVLTDVDIGDDVEILPNCVIENAVIGASCRIGPFSRIRPHTVLADHVHIGNFVEIKQANVGTGSKINHLSYIGDAEIGRDVNIGAGTITCNYDGANKHKTVIGNHVFIGSDSQLIAPIQVGDGATIGAGTTLTRDAPPAALTLSRPQQVTVVGWDRPQKKTKT